MASVTDKIPTAIVATHNIRCVLAFIVLITNSLEVLCQNERKDYSDQEPTLNSNNIYRSTANKYMIKLPTGWSIHKGNSLGAEFNAQSTTGDATFNIIVANLTQKPTISAHDIPIDKIMEVIKQRTPGATLLESKNIYLSNEKAVLLKYKFTYKVLDVDAEIICNQYSVFRGTNFYTLTFQTHPDVYEQYDQALTDMLISFTFED